MNNLHQVQYIHILEDKHVKFEVNGFLKRIPLPLTKARQKSMFNI